MIIDYLMIHATELIEEKLTSKNFVLGETLLNSTLDFSDEEELTETITTQTMSDNRDMGTSCIQKQAMEKSINATVEKCSRLVGSTLLTASGKCQSDCLDFRSN